MAECKVNVSLSLSRKTGVWYADLEHRAFADAEDIQRLQIHLNHLISAVPMVQARQDALPRSRHQYWHSFPLNLGETEHCYIQILLRKQHQPEDLS